MNILLPCGHESDLLDEQCFPCSKYKNDEKYRELCYKLNQKRIDAQTPNLIQKTLKAGEALYNYIKANMPNFLISELSKNRQEICLRCTEYNVERDECSKCGCKIALKKEIPTEDCPMGKWPRINLNVVQGKCGGCGSKS